MDLDAYDENLEPTLQIYMDEAHEIETNKLEEARNDIKYIMEDLLPTLLQIESREV